MCGESEAMRFLFLTLAAGALASAPAQATQPTRNYSVQSFDRIRLDGPYKVRLVTGVAPFARASGATAALDSVAITVQGRTLIISRNRSTWGGYPGQPAGAVEIQVGTHELGTAWLNGAGSLTIDRVRGLSFDLSVQGAGAASIARVEVDQLKVGLAGAGSATLAGRAPKMTALVRGASLLDASALMVKDVTLGAEGPAIVKLNAVSSANIQIAGTASVEIIGNPACTIKATGSATVSGCR